MLQFNFKFNLSMLFAFMSVSDKQIRMINDYVPSLCLLATYVNHKGHIGFRNDFLWTTSYFCEKDMQIYLFNYNKQGRIGKLKNET